MKELEILRKWFLKNKRSFPWREERTPYRVWISEVMLQQTRANVVVDYFTRWMQRFPDIQTLAKAPEEEVLKLWEGLGYYSRARAIHSCAKLLTQKGQTQLPSTVEELLKMKGIGAYTAGAIASFAFGKKAVALDGNVMRVWARLKGEQRDIALQTTKNFLSDSIHEALPDDNPSEVMEALIELGATLCVKNPHCRQCPLKAKCFAYHNQAMDKLPFKSKRYKINPIFRSVACIYYENRLLVKKNEKGKIMADLWEFPYFEGEDIDLHKYLTYMGFNKFSLVKRLDTVIQYFTSYKATLFPSIWKVDEPYDVEGYDWVEMQKLYKYPFSSGHRAILNKLKL